MFVLRLKVARNGHLTGYLIPWPSWLLTEDISDGRIVGDSVQLTVESKLSIRQ